LLRKHIGSVTNKQINLLRNVTQPSPASPIPAYRLKQATFPPTPPTYHTPTIPIRQPIHHTGQTAQPSLQLAFRPHPTHPRKTILIGGANDPDQKKNGQFRPAPPLPPDPITAPARRGRPHPKIFSIFKSGECPERCVVGNRILSFIFDAVGTLWFSGTKGRTAAS
jgi:hypothetical protein